MVWPKWLREYNSKRCKIHNAKRRGKRPVQSSANSYKAVAELVVQSYDDDTNYSYGYAGLFARAGLRKAVLNRPQRKGRVRKIARALEALDRHFDHRIYKHKIRERARKRTEQVRIKVRKKKLTEEEVKKVQLPEAEDVNPTIPYTEEELCASICMDSFYEFFKEFWSEVVKEDFCDNWHINYLCDQMQVMAERIFKGEKKQYDLCVNISPGTTKSTIMSVMFPAWCWIRMPSFRFIGASYSLPLAMDLSMKTRDVVESEKYKRLFPHVKIREDQNTKHYFKNTAGGFRYSVGVSGAVLGMHAHCFPWGTLLTTDKGLIPIGKVVEEKLPVKVLAFDHKSNRTRWQPIRAYGKSAGKPMCRVYLSNGTVLDSTCDHPIYSYTKGEYRDACELDSGERVICHAAALCESVETKVRVLSETGSEEIVRTERSEKSILQSEMSGERMEFELSCGESPEIFQQVSKMLSVRNDNESSEGAEKIPSVLQQEMSRQDNEGVFTSSLQDGEMDFMPSLQKGDPSSTSSIDRINEILLQRMCRRLSLGANEGERESTIHERPIPPEISEGVYGCVEKEGEKAGEISLFRLSQKAERGRTKTRGSPCGLRQDEQSDEKSCSCMPTLSRGDARFIEESIPHGTATVVRVERQVRIPEAVYNLDVAEDHNYFTEGVLVHNCIVIDDPLNPQEALSQADIQASNHWIKHTLSTRKVNKEVSCMALVMQRLHQDDPTTQFHRQKHVRKIVLPAELEEAARVPVHPPELKAFYKDGLMDPNRMSRKVLEEEKAKGEWYYSSQFRQDPVPAGGGKFKTDRIKAAPMPQWEEFVRLVRFWDKAGTKGGGAYTVGLLLGQDKSGRFWILDVVRGRWDSFERERRIENTADSDGVGVLIGVEQEGGSGGKESAENTARNLAGYRVRIVKADPTEGGKEERADPFSTQVNAGNVYMPDHMAESTDGPKIIWSGWAFDLIEEFKFFPFSKYKDQVDAASGAFNLCHKKRTRVGGINPSNNFAEQNVRSEVKRLKQGQYRNAKQRRYALFAS